MRAHYSGRSVYRYFSKLDDHTSFETAELARADDIAVAVGIVGSRSQQDLETALRQGDARLAKALRFLADEIEDAGCSLLKSETA